MILIALILGAIGLVATGLVWLQEPASVVAAEPPELSPSVLEELDPPVRKLIERSTKALLEERQNGERWVELGMAYEANGYLDLGLKCYAQAVSLDDSQAKWWYRLALAREQAGQMDQAIDAATRVNALAPDFAPGHWRLGLWKLNTGDLAGAQAAFQQAVERDASDTVPRIGLARVHLQSNEPALALTKLEHVLRSEAGPYREVVAQLRANALRAQGRIRAADSSPRNPSLQHYSDPWADELDQWRRNFNSLELLAQELAESGDFERSVQLYRTLLAIRPNQMQAMANLGRVLVEMGRIEDGYAMLQESIRLHPDFYVGHLNAAQACEMFSRRSTGNQATQWLIRALGHADQALKINSTAPQVHGVRARLLALLGQSAEAVRSAMEAARLEPENPRWRYDAATYHMQLQQWPEAQALLEKVAKEAPDNFEVHGTLAVARMNLGDLDGAADALATAKAQNADDPRIAAAEQQLRRLRESAPQH